LENLKALTESLLFIKDNHKIHYDSIHAMHELYASLTNIRAGNVTDENIRLASGEAISPIEAAHCLLQTRRTVVFLRGIYDAIGQLKKYFPGEKINILYAGCGPYATLLTPFTSIFGPEEMGFYMLDISAVSLDSVRRLYAALGADDFIKDIICADAATYTLAAGERVHMVISETMQYALDKEPQVAIMMNLIPQMSENTVFIPEEIVISAKLLNVKDETDSFLISGHKPERMHLGDIFSIGRNDLNTPAQVSIDIPKDTGRLKMLYLFTDITVYRENKLGVYDCGLNLPFKIAEITEKKGKKITFRYEISESPGFRYEWVES